MITSTSHGLQSLYVFYFYTGEAGSLGPPGRQGAPGIVGL